MSCFLGKGIKNERGEEKEAEGDDNRWDLSCFFLFVKKKSPKPQADNPPRKPNFISSIELESWCFSEDYILVNQLFKISAKILTTQNQKLGWDFPKCLSLTFSEMPLFSFPKYLMQHEVSRRLQRQRALQKKAFLSLCLKSLAFLCFLSLVLLKSCLLGPMYKGTNGPRRTYLGREGEKLPFLIQLLLQLFLFPEASLESTAGVTWKKKIQWDKLLYCMLFLYVSTSFLFPMRMRMSKIFLMALHCGGNYTPVCSFLYSHSNSPNCVNLCSFAYFCLHCKHSISINFKRPLKIENWTMAQCFFCCLPKFLILKIRNSGLNNLELLPGTRLCS